MGKGWQGHDHRHEHNAQNRTVTRFRFHGRLSRHGSGLGRMDHSGFHLCRDLRCRGGREVLCTSMSDTVQGWELLLDVSWICWNLLDVQTMGPFRCLHPRSISVAAIPVGICSMWASPLLLGSSAASDAMKASYRKRYREDDFRYPYTARCPTKRGLCHSHSLTFLS